MRWIVILLLLFAACQVRAQEFHALGGVIEDIGIERRANSWQIEYREGLGEHFAYSLSYLNEGHIPNHHRDGHAIQFWGRANLLDRRLSLSAGAGPYAYYDTTPAPAGKFLLNDHGWGALVSLAATFYMESRWLLQLRSNWAGTGDSIDTLAALFGIGYQLDPPSAPGPLPKAPSRQDRTTRNEITVFLGETYVHNSGPRHSLAAGVEYRRGLWEYVDCTATLLHEGENSLSFRNGLATQLWAVRAFFDDRLTLGIGGGAHIAVDRRREPQRDKDDDLFVSGIVTMTSSYRLDPDWGLRVSWNRIITDHDRDSDVWLGGIGYRF